MVPYLLALSRDPFIWHFLGNRFEISFETSFLGFWLKEREWEWGRWDYFRTFFCWRQAYLGRRRRFSLDPQLLSLNNHSGSCSSFDRSLEFRLPPFNQWPIHPYRPSFPRRTQTIKTTMRMVSRSRHRTQEKKTNHLCHPAKPCLKN